MINHNSNMHSFKDNKFVSEYNFPCIVSVFKRAKNIEIRNSYFEICEDL